MKVILNSDLPNLGEEGDICDVADGYARNYLLPRKLVLQYNGRNLELLEERRDAIEQRREEKRKEAMSVKDRLQNEPLEISMPAGENGRLFGSVTSSTITEQLEKLGIDVQRKQIEIPGKTIKSVGATKIRVRLYDGEEAELVVEVKAAGNAKPEADEQAQAPAEATPQVEQKKEESSYDPYDEEEYDDYDDYDEDYDDEDEDDD